MSIDAVYNNVRRVDGVADGTFDTLDLTDGGMIYIGGKKGQNNQIITSNGTKVLWDDAGSHILTYTLSCDGLTISGTPSNDFDNSRNITIAVLKVPNVLKFDVGLTGTTEYDGSSLQTLSVEFGTTSTTACVGNDARLSDTRANPNAISVSGTLSGTSYDGSSAVSDWAVDESSAFDWTGAHTWSYTADTTLTMTSTKDLTLILEADSDNVTETDNPTLIFYQDDRAIWGKIGLQSTGNSFVINTNEEILLSTENTTRMAIADTQVISYIDLDLDYATASTILYTNASKVITSLADGDADEVLSTNGSGTYSWVAQTDTTYTAGNGLSLSTNEFLINTAYSNTWSVGQTMKDLTLNTGAGLDCKITLKEDSSTKWAIFNDKDDDYLYFAEGVGGRNVVSFETPGSIVVNSATSTASGIVLSIDSALKWTMYAGTDNSLNFLPNTATYQAVFHSGLGVGQSTPEAQVHIKTDSGGHTDQVLWLESYRQADRIYKWATSGSSGEGLDLRDGYNSDNRIWLFYNNSYQAWYMDGTEQYRIDTAGMNFKNLCWIGDGTKSSTAGLEGYLNVFSDSDLDPDNEIGVLISGVHNSTGFLSSGTSLYIEGLNNDSGSEITPLAFYEIWEDENSGYDMRAYTTSGVADGKIRFGGTATFSDTYRMYVSGSAYATGSWASSDERCKTDIKDYDTTKCLKTILGIEVKTYKYEYFYNNPTYIPQAERKPTIGFIAQQIENLECVRDANMIQKTKKQFKKDKWGENNRLEGTDDKIGEQDYITLDDFLDVEKTKLLPMLIGSIQQLQLQITELKNEVEILKSQ